MREYAYSLAETPSAVGDADEEEGDPTDAVLLGSKADKAALRQVLQRFSKDNLADESDHVVAAIRMQVKGVPPFRRLLNIVSTLGLWLVFQPREDSASLLLTKQGRFICWGRGQEAQPGAVRAYLGQVICFLFFVFAIMLFGWSWIFHMEASFFVRGACFVFTLLLLLLVVVYVFAQRPRRDCGSTFRQHFEVQELCVGTYVRVDEGRHFSQLCARRRLGHLQLCFSRRFPKAELLSERLPPGAVGCKNVEPLADPPPALAGDSQEVQKEVIEQEGGLNNSFLARVAAVLAVLSLIGAAYDYTAFLDKVRIDGQLCLFKVHGCNWRVENSRLLGKVKRVEGANPPADYAEGGCTADGDYCDYFLRPTAHCAEKGEAFTNDITAIHIRLECKVLPALAEATTRVTFVNPYEGTGQVHTMFLMQHDLTVWSMPLDETSTHWNKVLLTEGMRIVQIGPKDSRENQNLRKGVALHPVELLGRCLGEYRGHVDLVLVETQDLVPMFEEDCQGLQEACKAEGLGPETNGYWPPHRIFDHSYEKTICIYRSLRLPGWLGKVWTVLEQGEQGLTCRGQARKRIRFDNVNNSMITTRVESCKDACAKEPWCSHVFYKGEVPEAFRTEFDFIPPTMKEALRVHNATRSSAYECLLYETCPVASMNESKEEFVKVPCGEHCGEDNQRCMMVRQGFQRQKADSFLGHGLPGCRQACRQAVQDVAQCNAFVYSPANGGSCTLYGPDLFMRPFEGWKTLDVNYVGAVGEIMDQSCFLRSTDPYHQGQIRDRQFANSPGILLRFTDKTTCGGCVERTLFNWLREPSAMCMVLSHLITLLGACYVARRAHTSVQLGKAAFSGKPVVHMSIVQDPANPDNFEVREAAYRAFLSKCCQVAESCGREDEATHEAHEVDCWETGAEKIVPTHAHNYETYDLSNKRRTKCFIDKELLGIQPDEKVRTAWSDTPRHGIYKMLFGFLFYYLVLYLVSWVAPESFKAFWTAVGFRPLFLVIIPFMVVLHHYVELRREVESLFVLTSWGRLLHLTRRPPPNVFPAALCPVWYGGTSIQLDSFKIGRISLAQLDMPAKPLLEDRLRSGFQEAWRRGSVTLRGSRGLLQIRREHGEALEMYQGLTSLAERRGRPIQGLRSVGDGGAVIAGLCPKDDVLIPGERHIWEHRLDAFGFFGDPFNYSTLLSLSDQRILVTRARWPKAFSLVGCLIGPRTCSNNCSILMERWGHFPYVTVTSVWYESLESYVTQRVRAPPFWPGCMKPIMSLSVNFLEKWMQSYPSALQVTQRPYGIPQDVTVKSGRQIWLRSVAQEERLRIMRSNEPAAPRGQYVEEIWEGGEELDLGDSYWSKDTLAPEGAKLVLQAGDTEWDGYADEPWLHQMREILDHISGRSQARPETWEVLEEPPRPDGPGGLQRLFASLVGSHMLGHHHSGEGSSDDE